MKEFLTEGTRSRTDTRTDTRTDLDVGSWNDSCDEKVVLILNQALATELVSVLRCKRHYYAAEVLDVQGAADAFLLHAVEKADHADMIAARISQLGGKPDFNPELLSGGSATKYGSSHELGQMIEEDLAAQRIAVVFYTEIIAWLGDRDPTTRRLIENILAQEEEHASDMIDLLSGLD